MSDTIGARIRAVRGHESQEAFASALGISKGSLGFYERDENLPNAAIISKICSKKGVSADWLVLGQGTAYDPSRTTVEPARAGMLRAGEPLTTVVVQQEAEARPLTAQVEEMTALRQENRELRQENRELRLENRELVKENADLRVAVAEMRARAAPERDASKEMPGEEARKSA